MPAHSAPFRRSAYDVAVVGAGPAGAAAATRLARSGRDVVLIDKAVFPRDKCCGDGLTTLALRELDELGFRPDGLADWFDVDGAWLRSPGGRETFVPLPDAGRFAAVCPRRELDAALVELAGAAGVTVYTGTGVTAVTNRPDHARIEMAGARDLSARYVIAADGMWSTVRKALGLGAPGYRGEWHAFRQYASRVTGPAAERLIVWFEADLLPGYAWSFPLPGGRVNIGFGVLRDGRRRIGDMGELWRDLLTRTHVVAALGPGHELEGRPAAWPIPARIDALPLTSGRVLFAGDATAATDVMTGEGIGQALLTARCAADAIERHGALRPGSVRATYEAGVRDELFADHRMARRLGQVLTHPRGAEWALRIVEHSGSWGRRNFARWMFEDEPRAIALTPSRWHRDLLRRPGAWA